jgi:hypothetical protein
MHKTPAGDRRKALQRSARELARDAKALQRLPAHPQPARRDQRLQEEVNGALAQAGAIKLQARLENLTVYYYQHYAINTTSHIRSFQFKATS